MALLHTLALAALLAYLASTALFIRALLSRQVECVSGRRVGLVAFTLHSALIVWSALALGFFQWVDRSDLQLGVSWFLGLAFLLAKGRLRSPIVGAFLLPAITLFLTSSSLIAHYRGELVLSTGEESRAVATPLLFLFHITPIVLGEVLLVLSLIGAVVFLLQERRFRRKEIDSLAIKGPSLEQLDLIQRRLVLLAFLVLTVAMLSGSIWILLSGVNLSWRDPYKLVGLTAWFVVGFLACMRAALGWSARRRAATTVYVVTAVLVGLFLLLGVYGSNIHGGGYV